MSTRVYLGTTLADLAAMRSAAAVPPGSGHAVTPWLRDQWPDGTEEEREYAVLMAAAEESAELQADGPVRRVVVVVEASAVEAEAGSTAVRTTAATPWRHVAAVHADAAEIAPGRASADLGWYAVQELDTLLL